MLTIEEEVLSALELTEGFLGQRSRREEACTHLRHALLKLDKRREPIKEIPDTTLDCEELADALCTRIALPVNLPDRIVLEEFLVDYIQHIKSKRALNV